jgi:hypothetical protein
MNLSPSGVGENLCLYGFTNDSITSVTDLAKSWNYPDEVSQASGCEFNAYLTNQKAWSFTRSSDQLTFILNASEDSPVVNPCFIIRNWQSQNLHAGVMVNGTSLSPGKNFRQGIFNDTDGIQTKMIWMKMNKAVEYHLHTRRSIELPKIQFGKFSR